MQENAKGLSYGYSYWFSPHEFSQFNGGLQSVQMQAMAERCYVNVTLTALSQKEAVLFIQFYWDVCLFENMNFPYVYSSWLD